MSAVENAAARQRVVLDGPHWSVSPVFYDPLTELRKDHYLLAPVAQSWRGETPLIQ